MARQRSNLNRTKAMTNQPLTQVQAIAKQNAISRIAIAKLHGMLPEPAAAKAAQVAKARVWPACPTSCPGRLAGLCGGPACCQPH